MNTVLIQEHVPLSDKNWFGTGGNARYFCQPKTIADFQEALHFAQLSSLTIFILGSGANVLISDEGFNGLVIHPHLTQLYLERYDAQTGLLTAQSGADMNNVIDYMLEQGYGNLEEFSGIPGTIGGAVYMNIHYFTFLLADFIVSARIINHHTGTVEVVNKEWFNFGYNASHLQEKKYYLIDVTFLVKKYTHDDVMFAKGRKYEIIRYRRVRYPTARTCGSFFRNFFEHEVTLESNGKKMIYVAYYLDKLGVKGMLQKGNAIVSYQHANMIVAKDYCTSTDIITLASTMQQMVHDTYGILPQTECELIGFAQYPFKKKNTHAQ